LPGFDTAAGLNRLSGDQLLYARLLASFARDYAGFAERIDRLLRNQEYAAARRMIHSFRGVAANLGATELAEAASVLEDALAHEQTDVLSDIVRERFGRTLSTAWSSALSYGEQHALPDEPAEAMSVAELNELIDELAGKLDRSDPTSESLWLRIRPHLVGSSTTRLLTTDRQVEAYEFAAAAQSIQAIRLALPPEQR